MFVKVFLILTLAIMGTYFSYFYFLKIKVWFYMCTADVFVNILCVCIAFCDVGTSSSLSRASA